MRKKTAGVKLVTTGGDEYIRLMKSKLETEAEVEDGEVVLQDGVVISDEGEIYIHGIEPNHYNQVIEDEEVQVSQIIEEQVIDDMQHDVIQHHHTDNHHILLEEDVVHELDDAVMDEESGFETPLSTQFACSLCDFETVQEEEIKTHMESHEICMVFSCKHCHFQAASKSSLRNHLTEAHEDLCYKCKNCEYKATTYGAMSRHVRTVHKGEKFPCSMCDYVATQKSNLTTHMSRLHSGFIICKVCKAVFNSKSELLEHEQTHQTIKKEFIFCTYENCNYKARSKYGLQLHVDKIHLGRRYVCDECNYIATQKCHLRVHIRTVHEGRSFPCHLCDHVASYKNNLKRHIISIHGLANTNTQNDPLNIM